LEFLNIPNFTLKNKDNGDHLTWRDSVTSQKKGFKYEEVDRISHLLGTAIQNFLINLKQANERNVGIYSKNRAEV